MNLTNDSYQIRIGTRNFTERYYRDKTGWMKKSARGRTFRMTAEQVLNHLLPALAGIKPNLTVNVDHHDANRHLHATQAEKGKRQIRKPQRPATPALNPVERTSPFLAG